MKKIYIIIILLISPLFSFSQDRIKIGLDCSMGLLPFFLSGTMDQGYFMDRPVYKHVDTTAFVGNLAMHLGVNFPFYKNDNWSTGAKLHAGLGVQIGLKAADGLFSIMFDFPEFLYFRHYKNFDYSILVGYKYTSAALPYQLMLLAFDFNSGFNSGDMTIRIYGSPFPYIYYSLYTNGDLRPAAKIYEFGVLMQKYF